MSKFNDLSNQRFDKLTVIQLIPREKLGNKKDRYFYYLCQCDCGKTKIVSSAKLRSGRTKSCGSCNKLPTIHVGDQFGFLKIIELSNIEDNHGNKQYKCQCSCGKISYKYNYNLLYGHSKSCGCRLGTSFIGKKFDKLTVLYLNPFIKYKAKYYFCECLCGNIISIPLSRLINKNTKSCGCLFKEKSGPKHHNWNFNLSDIERNARSNDVKETKWAAEIKKRDNFQCQVCGSNKSGELISHHLNSYSKFPELRYDLNNGICLCQSCHKEFHGIYGYKNFTSNSFYEFKFNFLNFITNM